MIFTSLGRTGVKVSRLCLGTMNFGPMTNEADSHAIMDKAEELGINLIDTADMYGREKGDGLTEQIVGRWLAGGNARRERFVLATKVYAQMGDGPNERGLSAYHIRRACEASLRRLRTDYIDLYQLHHVDRSTPWDEICQALEVLVRDGKVIYIGTSNFAAWQIATINHIAARRNMLGIVSEQSRYNLQTRTVELEVLPVCRAYDMGFLPWAPLGAGILSGVLQRGDSGRTTSQKTQALINKHRQQIERYESLCRQIGETPATVALAWLLSNPTVTSPVLGPRTLEQFTSSLRALEIKLDESTLKALDEIWPGPGGEAPEAYAW
ncbi:MAG TPA: aldo/keto reductase [Pyrinomonadaceae bacterium]|nr:aldo/keto reductase [Pyrinomonadaceae bacterium]